jgi:hypothetical protein
LRWKGEINLIGRVKAIKITIYAFNCHLYATIRALQEFSDRVADIASRTLVIKRLAIKNINNIARPFW